MSVELKVYPYTSSVHLNRQIDSFRSLFLRRHKKGLGPSEELPVDNFEFVQAIGEGGFGNIFLVKDRKTKECYALKVMDKETIIKRKCLKNVMTEKLLLGFMKFPFLSNMIASYKDATRIYFLMPFCNGGDLHLLLMRMRRFREGLAIFYAAQILLGLEFLHRCELIYRDLKLENVVLEKSGYVKIIDYGFTKNVRGRTYTFCGTPEYIAPEIILNKGHGFACDYWSFGVLIYEMVNGVTPFFSYDTLQIFENVVAGKYSIPDFFSPALTEIVSNLLQVETSRRLGNLKGGIGDIKDQAWFKYIHFSDIYRHSFSPPHVPALVDGCDIAMFASNKLQGMKFEKSKGEVVYKEEFKDF